MTRCVTCEGMLPDSNFSKGSPICSICVGKLQKVYHVEYSAPERKTIKDAYISLVLAIREQSIKDDELEDWEDYWLLESDWKRVWDLMGYVIEQANQSNGSAIRIGRHL